MLDHGKLNSQGRYALLDVMAHALMPRNGIEERIVSGTRICSHEGPKHMIAAAA